MTKVDEAVNPKHYQLSNGIQVHDLISEVLERPDLKFHHRQSYADLANVLKYALRLGNKEDHMIQLGKMQWYLNKIVERETLTQSCGRDNSRPGRDDTRPWETKLYGEYETWT